MSDKISALPEGTTLATGDLFPATDVSDTSESASGKTKKYSLSVIYNYIVSTLANFVSTTGNPSTGKLVPPVASGSATTFLNSLGAWTTPAGGYEIMNVTNSYAAGLVPDGEDLSASTEIPYLRKDGTWGATASVRIADFDTADFTTIFGDSATAPSGTSASGKALVVIDTNGVVLVSLDISLILTTATVNQIFRLDLQFTTSPIPVKTTGYDDYGGVLYMNSEADLSPGGFTGMPLMGYVTSTDRISIPNIKIPAVLSSVGMNIKGTLIYRS